MLETALECDFALIKAHRADRLGNLAFRTGKVIEWDAKNLRARGVPEADRWIHHDYRPGWKLS